MSMFNFFTVSAGLSAAGIGAILQGPPRLAALGVVLGMFLSMLALVFWKLDQRSAQLVKHAESARERIEARTLPGDVRLFSTEGGKHQAAASAQGAAAIWTFGKSLRLTFLTVALLGLLAVCLSAARLAGKLAWEEGVTAKLPQRSSQWNGPDRHGVRSEESQS